jgi:hypothetical protein
MLVFFRVCVWRVRIGFRSAAADRILFGLQTGQTLSRPQQDTLTAFVFLLRVFVFFLFLSTFTL